MRNKSLPLRVLSAAAALALISSCAVPAFAQTYFLEDGDITITAREDKDGSSVRQKDRYVEKDNDIIITNKDKNNATSSSVTINAGEGKTANVTLKDTNIEADDSAAVTTTGKGTVNIELDGDNKLTGGKDKDGKGYAGLQKVDSISASAKDGQTVDGHLNINDNNHDGGSLTANGTGNSAGIGGSDANVSVSHDDGSKASQDIFINGGTITANGAGSGAGIGGAANGLGEVTINGGTVTANGGKDGGAGIGGGAYMGNGQINGKWGSGIGKVTISGGNVTATGGTGASGIGGGKEGDSKVTITNGTVNATGGEGAAAIGDGADTNFESKSYVSISGGNVTANGGSGNRDSVGIGGTRSNVEVSITGGTITASGTGSAAAIQGDTVNISAEGSDLDLKATSPKGSAVKGINPDEIALGEDHSGHYTLSNGDGDKIIAGHNNTHGHTWDSGVVTKEPTPTSEGEKLYTCTICGKTYTETISYNHTHTWDAGVVTKEPTETEEGVLTRHCSGCDEIMTEPIPKLSHEHHWQVKERVEPTCGQDGYILYTCPCGGEEREDLPATGEHSWDAGVVTKEPTTESEGEKLYTCTVCGETYTEAIPKLDASSNSITAWYRVADGAQDYTLTCPPQVAGDTCTFAAELENATLSGNFAYLQQLSAQGVQTLCFVTAHRTTTLSLESLLARGDEDSVFVLTHTGADAALTMGGQAADELLG